jgi:hypothetical protein
VRGVHHQSIFSANVQDFTNTSAIDFYMCTVVHALTYMGTYQPDQPISRASLPRMSVSMLLSPIEHRAVAASPLQVTTPPPFFPMLLGYNTHHWWSAVAALTCANQFFLSFGLYPRCKRSTS